MHKHFRMTSEEALADCKDIILAFHNSELDYLELKREILQAYSKNQNEQPEFALFVKPSDLSQISTNSTFANNFDPVTRLEIMTYGMMGVLTFDYPGDVGGKTIHCYIYSFVNREKTINHTMLRMRKNSRLDADKLYNTLTVLEGKGMPIPEKVIQRIKANAIHQA